MALNIQRISGTTAKIAARLGNFVTSQSFLLPDHINFLDNEVAKMDKVELSTNPENTQFLFLFGQSEKKRTILPPMTPL